MTIKVFGAAFGRTGTDSMREALDMLGFGPCHHMREVNANEEQKRLWRALVRGTTPDWEQLFAGYQSCVDWPSSYYWRELISVYPKAKVILTYRSPESWWASFEKTVLAGIIHSTDPDALGNTLIRDQVFGGKPQDRALARKVPSETAMSATELLKTPLHALHLELGAKMVEFAGYEMPVNYPGGIIAEHKHCRESAALFDVSQAPMRRARSNRWYRSTWSIWRSASSATPTSRMRPEESWTT